MYSVCWCNTTKTLPFDTIQTNFSLSFSLQPGAKVHADMLSELVRPSIDYVRHKRFRSGNFPSSLSNESDRLVHWCHGAPGVIHMLIMAHKVRLLYAVLHWAAHISQHRIITTSICVKWPDVKALTHPPRPSQTHEQHWHPVACFWTARLYMLLHVV